MSQPETTATNKPAITSRQTPRVTDSQVALLLILQEKDVSNMVSELRLNVLLSDKIAGVNGTSKLLASAGRRRKAAVRLRQIVKHHFWCFLACDFPLQYAWRLWNPQSIEPLRSRRTKSNPVGRYGGNPDVGSVYLGRRLQNTLRPRQYQIATGNLVVQDRGKRNNVHAPWVTV